MNERDGRLLSRGLTVLAIGFIVLAVGTCIAVRRLANPPDPQEIVVTDDTGAERITLTCQGGVPSITIYDDAHNQACSLSVVEGVAQFAVSDGTAVRYLYPEDVRQKVVGLSASE